MSKVLSTRVSDEVFEAVQVTASIEGLSVNDWLRQTIEGTFLERKQDDVSNVSPEPIHEPASERIHDGLHFISEAGMTGDQVDAAMKHLGEKWGFLTRTGKFTGSDSEYASFLGDVEDVGLRLYADG